MSAVEQTFARKRHRTPGARSKSLSSDTLPNTANKSATTGLTAPISASVVLCCFLLSFVTFYGALHVQKALLRRHTSNTASSIDAPSFSSDHALQHIRRLGKTPREVNTPELEDALQYVYNVLQESMSMAAEKHLVLEVESFTTSGSFPCSIGHTGITVSYNNLLSIVARLRPKTTNASDENHALLVNAHVDSAFGAPGVNDNLIGVGIALELVRAIASAHGSENDPVLRRPVVFLFNGGEEPLLAGAHGFMTTHRWARGLAAHINTESIGAGDAYLLFQLGPRNDWLAHAYARATGSALASSAGNDVFDLGLIPGETDHRIFKAFGVPGFDFALIDNGNVYHTHRDDLDHLSKSAVHSGGRALLLPLTLELAGRHDAIGEHIRTRNVEEVPKNHVMFEKRRFSGDRATFFDVLSLFIVAYGTRVRVALDLGMLLIFVLLFAKRDGPYVSSMLLRMRMLPCFLASLTFGFVCALLYALFMTYIIRRPLSWYGSVSFAYALYGPPFVVGATTALEIMLPRTLHMDTAFDAMLHAVATFLAALLAAAHMGGLAAAYLPLLFLAPYVMVMATGAQRSNKVCLFIALNLPIAIFGSPNAHCTLSVLLSIMGRAGGAPSDIIVAVLVSFIFAFIFMPLVPLLASVKYAPRLIRRVAISTAIIIVTIVFSLPIVRPFPYSAVYSPDAPKRSIVVHFNAPQQQPRAILALVALDAIPLDTNAALCVLQSSGDILKELAETPSYGALQSNVGEFVRPYSKFLAQWSTFEVDQVPELAVPTAELLEISPARHNLLNVTVLIRAPGTMQLSLRVPVDNAVHDWSFNSPMNDLGGGAWVRHVGRGLGAEQLNISVLVRKDDDGKRLPFVFDVSSTRRLGVGGHYGSSLLTKLQFPEWATSVMVEVTGMSFTL